MKVVTAAQMRAIDRAAIDGRGIASLALMENAGRAVARLLAEHRSVGGVSSAIVAGGGHNGGDGCVAARELSALGARPTLYLASTRERLAPDTRVVLDAAERAGVAVRDLSDSASLAEHADALRAAPILIDALLGTGAHGEVRGHARAILEVLRSAEGFKVAIDVPSGLCADTGEPLGCAFQPDLTVTMGFPKLGLVGAPGFARAGRVVVADIGFPDDLEELRDVTLEWVEESFARRLLPRRSPLAHKGTVGHVLLVAGSPGKLGAAALAAQGAMRSGAGLCTIATPPECLLALGTHLLESMAAPVADWPSLHALCDGKRAVGFGPGVAEHASSAAMLEGLLFEGSLPVIVDASGLNLLASHPHLLDPKHRRAPLALTPHPGEAARLARMTIEAVQRDRVGWARDFAARHGAVVALKGARTVVAAPDGRAWINPTGNAGMATGGSGDVLLGVVTSLLGQELSLSDAMVAGVYLHGCAGDLARQQRGEMGMLARDVVENLPAVLSSWGL